MKQVSTQFEVEEQSLKKTTLWKESESEPQKIKKIVLEFSRLGIGQSENQVG